MKSKKLLLQSLLLLIIYSCSTPSTSTPSTPSTTNSCIGPQPKFQFKANGTLYVCDAVFDNRLGWVGNHTPYRNEGQVPNLHYASNSSYSGGTTITTHYYVLQGGVSTSSSETYINLNIQTNTLPLVSVPYNETNIFSDCVFNLGGGGYTTSTHSITFTRISNGTADGSFSGTVKSSSTPSNTVNITDGVFSNIPVFSN